MNKQTQEALNMAIDKWANNFTHERHQNNAETKFWLAQYKMAFNDLFNTCKKALEQPEQEIVRKVFDIDNFHPSVLDRIKFTSPSQWKDLSKEDIMDLFKVYPADPGFNILCDQVKMISDKLKEKNCE
jgi:hypothetical protein